MKLVPRGGWRKAELKNEEGAARGRGVERRGVV